MRSFELDAVKFDERGLVPAIVQDAGSGRVLMMAWMNADSLTRTLEAGETWFYSRSRQELWHKGATSGHVQSVRSLHLDCDGDTLLVQVTPAGPACHRGTTCCFGAPAPAAGFLHELFRTLTTRAAARPDGSYTAKLLSAGLDRVLRKIGEEAAETIIAAKNPSTAELLGESADLLYHLMVMLLARGLTLEDLLEELRQRHQP